MLKTILGFVFSGARLFLAESIASLHKNNFLCTQRDKLVPDKEVPWKKKWLK